MNDGEPNPKSRRIGSLFGFETWSFFGHWKLDICHLCVVILWTLEIEKLSFFSVTRHL